MALRLIITEVTLQWVTNYMVNATAMHTVLKHVRTVKVLTIRKSNSVTADCDKLWSKDFTSLDSVHDCVWVTHQNALCALVIKFQELGFCRTLSAMSGKILHLARQNDLSLWTHTSRRAERSTHESSCLGALTR